jgi:hypothetical protein
VSNQITIRKGTEEARLKTVFSNGEPVLCTDSLMVYMGDGVTKGGRPIRAVDIPYLRSAFSFRFNEQIEVTSVFEALDKIYTFMNNLSNNVYYGDLPLGRLPTTESGIAQMMATMDMVQTGPQGHKDLAYLSNYSYRTIIYPKYFGVLATVQDPALNYLDISRTYNPSPYQFEYQGTQFYCYITNETLFNESPKTIRYSFAYGSSVITTGPATEIPADPTVKVIHQEQHGFTVGTWLVRTTGGYTRGDASSDQTADIIGVVTRVVSPDDFIMTIGGYISGLPDQFVDGYTYFLSDSIPGALTTVPPTAAGAVNKPVFIADGPSSGFLINYRGTVN